MGSFDLTINLGTLVGVGGLVGGSRGSQFLNILLSSSRVFLDVVPSVNRMFFFTDN